MRDSGGLLARYGPVTQDVQRHDGQWLRIFFERPISERQSKRFAKAVAAGADASNARVRIVEIPAPRNWKGAFNV